MAVTLVTTIKRFEGTAAEMAAMDVTGVPAGSTFYQNDTGLIFGLSAAGAWSEKKTNGTVSVAAGTNLMGKVGIDQTTPGTTNKVVAELTGSNMELYGATVAARPLATAVTTGAIFMAINTQEIWQSNGTDWVVI